MSKPGRLDPVSAPCAASIDFDTAQAVLAAHVRPLGVETVSLAKAGGRVLAAPLIARIDAPRRDCAAMDGYAVRDADLATERRLLVTGARFAGDADRGAIDPGEAMRVMTGAPIPAGADRVIMVEHCRANGAWVELHAALSGKPHVRRRASDFAAGQLILDAGRRLGPPALVAAAAADLSHVTVWRQPRIHLIATGDEIVAPGTARDSRDTIPDSLTAAIALLCRQWGGDPVGYSHVADDADAIGRDYLRAQPSADVIVIIGGASRGDRDFGRAALAPLGLDLAFADVAIKPGKPVWFGRAGGSLVLGLPGNPAAALTVARLFLAPLIVALGGGATASALRWQMLPAGRAIAANGAREAFLCASDDAYGALTVIDRQEASGQAMLARTTALVRRPAYAPDVTAGMLVPALTI